MRRRLPDRGREPRTGGAVLPAAAAAVCLLVAGGTAHAGRGQPPAVPVHPPTPLAVEEVGVQGLRRTVRFHLPPRLASEPPLVIALHPSGVDGERFRQLTAASFDHLADRHGFIVAYPDGLGAHWRDCRAKAAFRQALQGVDEPEFLRAVAHRAAELARRPLGPRFAVGFSNGAHLVFRLALEAGGEYAALAAVAANLPVEQEIDCDVRGEAVPILLLAGTADPISPWTGGDVRLPGGDGRGRVRSAEDTAAFFRNLNGIRGKPEIARHPDRDNDGTWIEVRRWGADGREVVLVVAHGAGHTMPHPQATYPSFTGAVSRDVDAAEPIWEFFSRQTGRRGDSAAP